MSWKERVDGADWAAITAEVNDVGCALTPRLLPAAECGQIAGLYGRGELFRSTVEMARYRFGEGEYKYFASARGWSAGPVRHGVSAIRSGRRFTLGLVFHDAA